MGWQTPDLKVRRDEIGCSFLELMMFLLVESKELPFPHVVQRG